jgi:hypothetical protein
VTRVRCSEACALTAELAVDARTARRLRLAPPLRRVAARGVAALSGAGRTFVFVRMPSTIARRLFPSRADRVTARLTVEAVDGASNRRVVRRKLVIRR